MDELRWILLIVGLLILAGIYFFADPSQRPGGNSWLGRPTGDDDLDTDNNGDDATDPGSDSRNLDIPDEYHVMCVVAIGYQGPIDLLEGRSREYDESPRTRKEMDEIIFRDKFSG